MDKLPNELLLLIAEENIQEFEYMNYLPLLLVCKRWRSLFLSHAYACVKLDVKQIKSFLVTVQGNPSIATSIVSLQVEASSITFEVTTNVISGIRSRVAELSQSAEETAEWEKELVRGNHDAWIAVLLTCLSKLSSLHLNSAMLIGKYVRGIVSRAVARQAAFTPILQELQTFGFEPMYPGGLWIPFHAGDLPPFFHLPTMRRVELWWALIDSDNMNGDATAGLELKRGTLPITEIDSLGNGRHGLIQFIAACQNLESFRWRHIDIEVPRKSFRRFRPRAFHRSLSTQKHSLAELWLNHQDMFDVFSDLEEDEGGEQESKLDPPDNWFGSLADFVELQELRIRVVNLLDLRSSCPEPGKALKNILPGSLERLFITECHAEHTGRVHQELMELFACKTQKFPNLELLVIACKFLKELEPPAAARCECVPGSLQKSFIEPIKAAAEGVDVDFRAAYKIDHYECYVYATI
ncbi:hypothetical protein BO99DRAFT_60897 [Aspergillus violaceofuscus CBS 115571]|uniref:Leucine-rich repeat domain-containing protein n=1 Tax=Aspergillus violaceofuscus (strain CBS 115571) TaxID=1450538 RepID=A0A2V5HDC2_ASPV1|nr:hypothetical protein BO99DRAFT_60897 [Aspergillus violaceofuscus CBS 115571]